MSDGSGAFPWTEEQWVRARKVVQESARKTRVASSFLPLFGPLGADQVTANAMKMKEPADDVPGRLEVDDYATIALTSVSADIYLRTNEAADPEMSAALSMIGRAAVVLARVEDSIIFNGLSEATDGKPKLYRNVNPHIYQLSGGSDRPGLIDTSSDNIPIRGNDLGEQGANLVQETVNAISDMESHGHYGPYAQVLGNDLYRAANAPNLNSMVLPSDRIIPFLDGPLLRSGTLAQNEGVIVALGGEPIDIVVGRDLSLKFVQMSLEPRYVLRLSERFTLRIKQEGAVRVFEAVSSDD